MEKEKKGFVYNLIKKCELHPKIMLLLVTIELIVLTVASIFTGERGDDEQ